MSSYLVTGATGYVGSMFVKKLVNELDLSENQIYALVRNRQKAIDMLPREVYVLEANLVDDISMSYITGKFDYVIHFASNTKSYDMIHSPLEVTKSIVNGTQNVMDLACRGQAKSVIYISSMEVYGKVENKDGHLSDEAEFEIGSVDILSERSCYPLAKRMAENISYNYFAQHRLPVKIVRLAQVFGKGILESENRVFAQFARCAIEKKDIVLHTQGTSFGNYCEIEDALEAILLVLYNGQNGEAYNVVNEECTMMIVQMANLVANEVAKGEIKVIFDIPETNMYGYAKDTEIRLSAKKLRLLGWKPHKNMVEMYRDAIEIMRK